MQAQQYLIFSIPILKDQLTTSCQLGQILVFQGLHLPKFMPEKNIFFLPNNSHLLEWKLTYEPLSHVTAFYYCQLNIFFQELSYELNTGNRDEIRVKTLEDRNWAQTVVFNPLITLVSKIWSTFKSSEKSIVPKMKKKQMFYFLKSVRHCP